MERELRSFTSPADQERILRRINAILAELDSLTAQYLREDLPEQFKIGSTLALNELRKLKLPDLDGTYPEFHREAVQALADNARLRFGSAIETVRRDATVKLSNASKQAILQEILVKEIQGGRNATEAVTQFFRNQGVLSINTTRANISIENYAATLVRSISAEAHNTGAATRYATNGVEYARVIERDTACQICRPMDDKIIWLGDARLRPSYHPNCRGSIEPVPGTPDNPFRSPDDPRIPQRTREAMLRK